MLEQNVLPLVITLTSLSALLCYTKYVTTNQQSFLNTTKIIFITLILFKFFAILHRGVRLDLPSYLQIFAIILAITCLAVDYIARSSSFLILSFLTDIFNYTLLLLIPEKTADLEYNRDLLTHLSTIVISYIILHLSFLLSIFYIVIARSLKSKKLNKLVFHTPAIITIKKLTVATTYLGFVLLTVSILVGYFYASKHFESKLWKWDIKLWMLSLSWVFYCSNILLHIFKKLKFKAFTWGIIIAFIILFISQYTYLFGDFHSKL